MRFIFTIMIMLMVAYGWSQTATYHIDSLDTVTSGDVAYVYYHNQILERLHYVNDKIDVTVVYIYKDGLLVRREWWKKGKLFSTTWE